MYTVSNDALESDETVDVIDDGSLTEVQRAKSGLLVALPVYADDPLPAKGQRRRPQRDVGLVDARSSAMGWQQLKVLLDLGDDVIDSGSALQEIARLLGQPQAAEGETRRA